MMTTDEQMAEAPPIDRSLWIAILDAALPVVLVFWTLVDRSTPAMAGFARTDVSGLGIATPLY